MKYQKSYEHICNKKSDRVIEFIDSNKSKHDIKTICSILCVTRSTYKSFDKTKSAREVENEKLKSAINRIYKDSKNIYVPHRIHHIFLKEGFNVSLKRV